MTTAPRVRVNMGAFVLIKSTDTLANATQDSLVIIVVVSIHVCVYFASIDEKGHFLNWHNIPRTHVISTLMLL